MPDSGSRLLDWNGQPVGDREDEEPSDGEDTEQKQQPRDDQPEKGTEIQRFHPQHPPPAWPG